MQQFAAMKDICAHISKVLNTMFVSEIPAKHHLPAIIHKLAEDPSIPLWLPPRSREVLLSRPDWTVAAGNDGRITHASLQAATYNQGSKQNHHKHLATCHKNFHGKSGCRLFYPRGASSSTRPVLLDPLPDTDPPTDSADDDDSLPDLVYNSSNDEFFSPDDNNQDHGNFSTMMKLTWKTPTLARM